MLIKVVDCAFILFLNSCIRSCATCETSSTSWPTERLQLSECKAYGSSVLSLSLYPHDNGFDGDARTFMHLSPHENLDSGYEWYMLHVNSKEVQLIHSVHIFPRLEVILERSANMEILLAHTMSKILTSNEGEKNIPWHEFQLCGTTPQQVPPNLISVHCKKMVNARYIALRRMVQNLHRDMVMNFNEIQVDILKIPCINIDSQTWHEGYDYKIGLSFSASNENFKIIWFEHFLNHTKNRLTQEGSHIFFKSVPRGSPRRFFYELHDESGSLLYTSKETEVVHIIYAAGNLKMHPEHNLAVQEDVIIDIKCTSDAGYSHANLLLELDDVHGNRSSHSYLDPQTIETSIHVPAQLKWNAKIVTCTRIQAGFPNITKHIVLYVDHKNEGVIFNPERSFPSIFRKTLLHPMDNYTSNLSTYFVSAIPNEFNLSCSKNELTYFGMSRKPLSDLHIQLFSHGNYECVIDHKTCKKKVRVSLLRVSKQNCTCN